MATRAMSSRFATAILARTQPNYQTRYLSSQGTIAVEKLRNALEEYRAINYTQSIPSRFKKDIVNAAKNKDDADKIAVEGMQRVLANINMDHRVSKADVEIIFREIGERNGTTMSVDNFMKII